METRETSPRISHAVVGVVYPLLLSKWCSGTIVWNIEPQGWSKEEYMYALEYQLMHKQCIMYILDLEESSEVSKKYFSIKGRKILGWSQVLENIKMMEEEIMRWISIY